MSTDLQLILPADAPRTAIAYAQGAPLGAEWMPDLPLADVAYELQPDESYVVKVDRTTRLAVVDGHAVPEAVLPEGEPAPAGARVLLLMPEGSEYTVVAWTQSLIGGAWTPAVPPDEAVTWWPGNRYEATLLPGTRLVAAETRDHLPPPPPPPPVVEE